ncbi:hypothetical protein ACFFWC_02565 [Plantactinospora siamensis]|uniref:MoaD/ThiS family protein n=1 Tax=Plantactinospora siamensis TaxID=555372 RepID=A0ABV6NSM3_9ACTN
MTVRIPHNFAHLAQGKESIGIEANTVDEVLSKLTTLFPPLARLVTAYQHGDYTLSLNGDTVHSKSERLWDGDRLEFQKHYWAG